MEGLSDYHHEQHPNYIKCKQTQNMSMRMSARAKLWFSNPLEATERTPTQRSAASELQKMASR